MSSTLSPDELEFIKRFTNTVYKKYNPKHQVISFETTCGDEKMLYIVLENKKESRDKLIQILQDKNNQDV